MAVGQSGPGDARPSRLLTVGEPLGLLTAREPLRRGSELVLGVAGAELNVAIGVARLGGDVAWCGRVGDDEIGALVVATLRASAGSWGGRPTYHRTDGPGARLRPDDVPDAALAEATVLHVTGITPALSDGARATVRAAMERARAAGLAVSLDVNHRPALWAAAAARPVLEELVALAGHVFVGEDEAEALDWGGDAGAIGAHLAGLSPGTVIVKRSERGAVAFDGGRALEVPAAPTTVVDMHGAGDAFAAGYLTGLLGGAPLEARLATGAACAACVIARRGDWEGLPTRAELGGPVGAASP